MDKIGNLYIADEQKDVIRKVNTSGIISTFAGYTWGLSGDGGPASAAQLNGPDGIAIDDTGNIFISDGNNQRIRKINTAGIISSIAGGNPADIGCCPGCPSTSINLGPFGIAADHNGNVYVADLVHDVVDQLSSNDSIRNFAGNCIGGFAGDGGPANNAELRRPIAVCVDNKGNVLVADRDNNRVRKIWITGRTAVSSIPENKPLSLTIYSNPLTQQNLRYCINADINEAAEIRIVDVMGKVVAKASCITKEIKNLPLEVLPGVYIVYAKSNSGEIAIKKIVVE